MRKVTAVVFVAFLAGWMWLEAGAQSGSPTLSGAHRFERIADGIYYATTAGTMQVGANSPIIVAGAESIVIDSGTSPAAGRALIQDVKAVTDKPVKYVIDSHFHYDHLFGNQAFGPDVQIVGHDHTRERLKVNTLEQYTFLTSVRPIPARVEALRQRIAEEKDPQQKATLDQQVKNALAYQEQVKEVRQTPPNLTFESTMTIVRGGRELRLMYLGRGHTDTDVVTYLPAERIVATGDLMESVLSYMGDSYPEEWIATLERLKALDFDTVLPGHGVPFKGKERITAFQDYLKDLLAQTNALKRQGLSADEAAPKVDLTKHAAMFPQIRAVGVDPAVTRRIYRVAQEPNAGPTP
ncbi:MAG TPA: MBL fold metallo-hydrolase [Vicinamibacterales bacterium]|nr:MBL fold metallo-hydrolase [Vicinamibacterales bacterium]